MLPAGIATGFPFALPDSLGLWLLTVLGVLHGGGAISAGRAYKAADATYLQPFGDLKVPLTAVIGFIFLSQTPTLWFWIGSALIIGASLLIYIAEAPAAAGASPRREPCRRRVTCAPSAPAATVEPWRSNRPDVDFFRRAVAARAGDGHRRGLVRL